MEFDIGTILYVVITLIALVIGVLGKKKKPAGTGSPVEGARDHGGSFLESFERAFQMEREDAATISLERDEYEGTGPEIIEEPLYMESYRSPYEGVARPGKGPSILDDYERIMGSGSEDENGIFQEGQPSTRSIEVDDLDDEGTDYFEVVKNFDVGTAVIYSAIINRVDY